MKRLLKITLLIIIALPCYGKSINNLSADDAYQEGKNLALHLKMDKAKEYLKYAADKGNTNAMVRYAYLSSTSKLFLSPDAYDYMLMAAKKGHEWAMISIAHQMLTSDGDKNLWRTKFLQKMQPYIDKENPDALYLMSVLEQRGEDEREDWLIKAVDAGSCKATTKLYEFYVEGGGWFLTKNRRADKVDELARMANEQGCLNGKRVYMYWLYDNGKYNKAKKIEDELISMGNADDILIIGRSSMHKQNYGVDLFPVDYEKSAMYLKIYIEGFGNVSGLRDVYDGIKNRIMRVEQKLTNEQKRYVDSYVKEYLSTHDIKVKDTIWETKFN